MHSSTSHEQVSDDELSREQQSRESSSPLLIRDIHTSREERPLSQQDHLEASTLIGSGLDGQESQTGTELTEIRAMSIDSLQRTCPDAPRSVGSIQCHGRPGEVDHSTLACYSDEWILASKSEASLQPYGRSLPCRNTIQRDFFWCLAWLFDVVLTIIPLFFLAIAVLALRLDHQPRSELGERALSASRLGPTVFPIAFAAISSRFFQNLSRWLLERPNGIKLGILEQIAGSQSFPGAVQRTFTIRSGHYLSAMIILVWALSPIGGQSSLRLFNHGHTIIENKVDVFVANPEYQFSYFGSASGMSHSSNIITVLYSGLLLSAPSQRASPVDLWNHPKIPQVARTVLNNYNVSWQDISDPSMQNGDYASLLGLDVRGKPQDVSGLQVRFKTNTSYVDTECERVTSHRYRNMTIGKFKMTSFNASLQNYTDRGEPRSWYWNTERPGHRLFYDSKTMPAGLVLFECALQRIPVEVEFYCDPFPTGCGARRLRQRQDKFDALPPYLGENTTEEESFQILPWSMDHIAVNNMLADWPAAAGTPEENSVYGASATDNFLAGDDALFAGHGIRDWDRDISDMALFSRRMTTVFNTIFQVSLNPLNVTNANSSFIGQLRSSLDWDGPYWPLYDEIQAIASDTRDIYIADRRWCATLLLVGSILQILAISGLWLRAWIAGPELLGFASSLMRDNPYFPGSVNSCGSALGGADRARMCKDMRVQIADVRPSEESGYIVFKSVSPQGEEDLALGQRGLSGKRLFI